MQNASVTKPKTGKLIFHISVSALALVGSLLLLFLFYYANNVILWIFLIDGFGIFILNLLSAIFLILKRKNRYKKGSEWINLATFCVNILSWPFALVLIFLGYCLLLMFFN